MTRTCHLKCDECPAESARFAGVGMLADATKDWLWYGLHDELDKHVCPECVAKRPPNKFTGRVIEYRPSPTLDWDAP